MLEVLHERNRHNALALALRDLDDAHAEVVSAIYGLRDGTPHSSGRTAQLLRVPMSEVLRLQAEALAAMRERFIGLTDW